MTAHLSTTVLCAFLLCAAKGGGLPASEGTFPFPSLAGAVLQVIRPGLHCGEGGGTSTEGAGTGRLVGRFSFRTVQPWAIAQQAAQAAQPRLHQANWLLVSVSTRHSY